ncbi:MAG: DUF624 domain-containing protein [Lachnospiraceae bacterium]|nr:DUF624 domain-containing protein [Lachnospiraceae bacterium]
MPNQDETKEISRQEAQNVGQENKQDPPLSAAAARLAALAEDPVVDPNGDVGLPPVPTTRKERFLRGCDLFGDMVFLNIMFAVGCVPLITIGASFTALYSVMLKMVRNEEGAALKSFWKEYRKNLIPATKVWFVVLLMFAGVYVEYVKMVSMSDSALKSMILVIGLEFIFFAILLPLLFPLVARYENTTFNYLKNSVVLALSRPTVWVRVLLMWIGPVLITLSKPKIFYYTWYLWIFIFCGLLSYASSLIIRGYFDELEGSEKEKVQAAKEEEKQQAKAPSRSIAGKAAYKTRDKQEEEE